MRLFFSLLFVTVLIACVEVATPTPKPLSREAASPPASLDFVRGPYPTRGQIVATTDIRSLGCPQCTSTSRILATLDLNKDGSDEIVMTMESFGPNNEPFDSPTRMSIVTASGAPYRGVNQLPSRVHAREAVIADFNGDGVDDLFVAAHGLDTHPFPGEQNVLLLSQSAGRHLDASFTHLPRLDDMAHGADAADIDGDSDIDIVVITNAGGGRSRVDNYVLLNDGMGHFTFSAGRNHLPANAARVNSALTARLVDLNLDGAVDLLLAGTGDTQQPSRILYGDGKGKFSRTVILPRSIFGAKTWTTDIDVIDLNRDGQLDILLTNTGEFSTGRFKGLNIQVLMQEGGRFVDRSNDRLWGQDWHRQGAFNLAHNLSLVDLNNDGAEDLVVQSLNPVWERQPGDMPTQIGLNDGAGNFLPVSPSWLDTSSGFEARQLLPLTLGRRTVLVGHSLFGEDTASGFRSYGQRLTVYR